MTAVEGFIAQLERRVVCFAVEPFSLLSLRLILSESTGSVSARKGVDVRRVDFIKGLTLFANNILILTCITLHLISCLDTVKTSSGTRQCRQLRLEVALTAARLADFMFRHLLVVIQTEIILVSP